MTHPSSWLELSRANLAHNLARTRELCGGSEVVAIIKANAYGAGAPEMAMELSKLGVETFAVATLEEALELRDQDIVQKIVCLAPFVLEDVDNFFEHHLVPTVFTQDAVDRLANTAARRSKPWEVWVKVDTGLHRWGVEYGLAADFLKDLTKQSDLRIGAVYSTFVEDPDYDRTQVAKLRQLQDEVSGLEMVPLSLASSYGILSKGRPDLLDFVRPGIMLQGFLPSGPDRLDSERSRLADLHPIATWKARVAQVRLVPKGGQVGYGAGKGLDRETRVATLLVGWAEGYVRSANPLSVLIRGEICPVLSVSANATMVDATTAEGVSEWDEAVLVGRQGDAEIEATELVGEAGSVYRAFASIPSRIPRVWV